VASAAAFVTHIKLTRAVEAQNFSEAECLPLLYTHSHCPSRGRGWHRRTPPRGLCGDTKALNLPSIVASVREVQMFHAPPLPQA